MIFHEICGAYFRAVEEILREAGAAGGIDARRIREIAAAEAFAESGLTIPEKLLSGDWPLLRELPAEQPGQTKYEAAVQAVPRPVTLAERRWLKSLLTDPRLGLFLWREEDRDAAARLEEELKEVPALWEPDTFVYYDRYGDGDDVQDPEYVRHFHTILQAMEEGKWLSIRYSSRGRTRERAYRPVRIEYSSKDDKFRLLCLSERGHSYILNLSRMESCRIAEGTPEAAGRPSEAGGEAGRKTGAEAMPAAVSAAAEPAFPKSLVELELTDERNALQRAMIHFSDLQKETERIDEKHYRIRLSYYQDDETELLIRILSFGPLMKVTAPETFLSLIRERIESQRTLCGL